MRTAVTKHLQLLSGSHHPELAAKVARKLKTKLSSARVERFANGEVRCQLEESVRGADAFVFQSHSVSVNDAIMEQAIIIDAAKRASARHITAVCPFLGYARQDRKASGREPITAKLAINILAVAGADRVVSIDLHSGQIQGFFDGPFDHLIALPVLADRLKKKIGSDFVIVSPDAGRVRLAERYASRLGCELAIVHKRRSIGKVEALHVIGDVKGRHCVVVDDMIDTAGTICAAAEQLKRKGAKTISAAATHGIFSPPAEKRLKTSAFDHIVTTDTLPMPDGFSMPTLETVSIANLLALAVKAIFEERSVSALFKGANQL